MDNQIIKKINLKYTYLTQFSYDLRPNFSCNFAMKLAIGFTAMNAKIFDVMRDWVITKYKKHYSCYRGDDVTRLRIMNSLAVLYRNQGKYDEALPLYEECLEKRRSISGNDHPSTLTCISHLASLYREQGKYDEEY